MADMRPEFVDCSSGFYQIKVEKEEAVEDGETYDEEDDNNTIPFIKEEILNVVVPELPASEAKAVTDGCHGYPSTVQLVDRLNWPPHDVKSKINKGETNESTIDEDDSANIKQVDVADLNEPLKSHEEQKSVEETQPHICSECGNIFKYKSTLVRHKKSHSGIKPFQCSNCGRGFRDKFSLTEHTRTHTKEKPFTCSYCDKSFIQKRYLAIHWRTHTGDKPLECAECGKRFSQRSSQAKHQLRHAVNKPC